MRVDDDLVRRIERNAAQAEARHAELLASMVPASGAAAEWFDSSAFVALGAGRYVNRALAFGLGTAPAPECVDALERFFAPRALAASAEVSPFVSGDLLREMRRRSYGVDWFRNVYARELDDLPPRSHGVPFDIRQVSDETYDAWREVLGNDAAPGTAERAMSDESCDSRLRIPRSVHLVGTIGGEIVTTGSVRIDGDIASIGGAATLASARGRGAQRAMIVDRLHRARDGGASLATATALADGSSARNLAALGFQLLYTQVVLTKPL